MSEKQILVIFDTDRIHEYVFSTNKLKEIRGASSLLDELNEEKTVELLHKWHGREIFIGGGSGKAIFDSDRNANKFCAELKLIYKDKTDDNASMTSVIHNHDPEHFKESILKGELALKRKKEFRANKYLPITNHYFKTCMTTGSLPAEPSHYKDYLSKSSQIKRDSSEKYTFYHKFIQFIKKTDDTAIKNKWKKIITKEMVNLAPKDLNSIGKQSNGYIGLIYADGNRMGQKLKGIDKEELYKKFSSKVKEAVEKALYYSIAKHLDLINNQFPFEILLLGGDDLIVVVYAKKAINIAIDICNEFKKETKIEEVASNGISMSAGVLITHANYPMHQMIYFADQLLKSAKALSNEEPEAELNCIDFMVIKNPVIDTIENLRKKEYSYKNGKDIQLICRPYKGKELLDLTKKIELLKEVDFPHTKLKQMYEFLYGGFNQAILDYCFLLTRLPEDAREVLKDEFLAKLIYFPWKQKDHFFTTDFLDLIEIYDFIE